MLSTQGRHCHAVDTGGCIVDVSLSSRWWWCIVDTGSMVVVVVEAASSTQVVVDVVVLVVMIGIEQEVHPLLHIAMAVAVFMMGVAMGQLEVVGKLVRTY